MGYHPSWVRIPRPPRRPDSRDMPVSRSEPSDRTPPAAVPRCGPAGMSTRLPRERRVTGRAARPAQRFGNGVVLTWANAAGCRRARPHFAPVRGTSPPRTARPEEHPVSTLAVPVTRPSAHDEPPLPDGELSLADLLDL